MRLLSVYFASRNLPLSSRPPKRQNTKFRFIFSRVIFTRPMTSVRKPRSVIKIFRLFSAFPAARLISAKSISTQSPLNHLLRRRGEVACEFEPRISCTSDPINENDWRLHEFVSTHSFVASHSASSSDVSRHDRR